MIPNYGNSTDSPIYYFQIVIGLQHTNFFYILINAPTHHKSSANKWYFLKTQFVSSKKKLLISLKLHGFILFLLLHKDINLIKFSDI